TAPQSAPDWLRSLPPLREPLEELRSRGRSRYNCESRRKESFPTRATRASGKACLPDPRAVQTLSLNHRNKRATDARFHAEADAGHFACRTATPPGETQSCECPSWMRSTGE